MFEVNWSIVVNYLLPPLLRRSKISAYLNALLAPFKELNNTFNLWRADNLYKIRHSGQVCRLTAAINDAFDPDSRRFYITDSGGYQVILINADEDGYPIYLFDDFQGSAEIIHNDSAYEGGEFDFVVFTPFNLSMPDYYRLKALLDFYKLAGKRYDIVQPVAIDVPSEDLLLMD
jgi:hypothetical protein